MKKIIILLVIMFLFSNCTNDNENYSKKTNITDDSFSIVLYEALTGGGEYVLLTNKRTLIYNKSQNTLVETYLENNIQVTYNYEIISIANGIFIVTPEANPDEIYYDNNAKELDLTNANVIKYTYDYFDDTTNDYEMASYNYTSN